MRSRNLPHLVQPNIQNDGLVISILREGASYENFTACENRFAHSINEAKSILRPLLADAHPRLSALVRMASGSHVGWWIMSMRTHETTAHIADGPDSPIARRVPANTDIFLETILDHPMLAAVGWDWSIKRQPHCM